MSETKSTYIILLRAVNVSGKNILKMAELKEALTAAGFAQVQTYIQSGNIILQASQTPHEVKAIVESLLLAKFGLAVSSFVVDATFLEKAIQHNPISGEPAPNRLFITVLDKTPDQALLTSLQALDHSEEEFEVIDNVLYFYLPNGAAKAKMSNNYFERKLKVVGTGRNLNTVQKLIELARAIEQTTV